ncbi:Pre-mRNA-processing ATP-dependent RNA helicase PRP5 [Labeo rohita]|uniref:Pre-mRNA-processing ATP-dependent RNA helicase PRP5 n=1 Tax=Labeo rohita TaxID=84645 RepID=A0ABQ8L5I5_LABRO|nr:Pre-mRNA-processing ATP-dependent RNA helicase PRP5 [Labeo rohita]
MAKSKRGKGAARKDLWTAAGGIEHVRAIRSRKRRSVYLNVRAKCTFSTCWARYSFSIKTKPSKHQTVIPITVSRAGESNKYYKRLQNTPVQELLAGNISYSLSKNILKVISHEIKKKLRTHDNILLETQLTQSIIKHCDITSYFAPGYVQHFQVNPFRVHLYTETGLSILVSILRDRSPVSLYLDATGGVISRIPDQNRSILYYSLTLPGKGRDAPLLPVSEMIAMETDYSLAMMQAVLLAFNKETMPAYLERTSAIFFIARKFSQTVRESLAFLEGLISSEDAILQDTTEEVPEKLEVGDSLSATTVGSSPYSRLFQGIHDDVKAIVEDENPQHEENLYYCPEVITFLLDNYMGVYPLWSGVLLGDLKRYAYDKAELPIPEHHKKRDTNYHVEQWFCIVKTSILRKKRHLRPAQLIQAMYRSLKGRYKDYIMRNNLPDDILLRRHRPSSNVSFTEDRWGRRPSKKHKKGTVKSHFYRAPFEMPTPMIQRIAPTIGNVTDVPEGVAEKVLTPTPCEVSKPKRNPAIKCIDLTNEKDISEGEVSVEVMEGYILAILNKHDKSGQLYQLNHYITGVILHGKKEEVARQGLKDDSREMTGKIWEQRRERQRTLRRGIKLGSL